MSTQVPSPPNTVASPRCAAAAGETVTSTATTTVVRRRAGRITAEKIRRDCERSVRKTGREGSGGEPSQSNRLRRLRADAARRRQERLQRRAAAGGGVGLAVRRISVGVAPAADRVALASAVPGLFLVQRRVVAVK